MNGKFNIGDGGKVKPIHRDIEPAYRRNERDRIERARNYYPNPNEQALEKEMMNQVSNKPNLMSAANFTPAGIVWPEIKAEAELSALLFNQVASQYTNGEQKPLQGNEQG